VTADTGRLSEVVEVLRSARARLLNGVRSLSQPDLDVTSSQDGWSIGEILHHLQLIEASVARLLGRLLEHAARDGLGPDPRTDSVLGRLDQFDIEGALQKVVTPTAFIPQKGSAKKVLLEGLAASRAALLAVVEKAGAFDLSQLSFPHPVLGRIDGYQWLLYVGQHELRHLHQIERSKMTETPR
jgi:DinB superfamily